MPQFDFDTVFTPQLFWLAVLFIVLYFGVVRMTLPKLGAVMAQREDKIADDLSTARLAKDNAEAVSAAYQAELATSRDAARAAMAEAKAGAAKASEARLAQAGDKADAELAAAEARIAQAVAEAEAPLRDVSAEGAQAIVSRLTGIEPPLAIARAQVDARLAG
jgi:F-type H+-transporting ATPase subunit b